jgi:hypothetical protein
LSGASIDPATPSRMPWPAPSMPPSGAPSADPAAAPSTAPAAVPSASPNRSHQITHRLRLLWCYGLRPSMPPSGAPSAETSEAPSNMPPAAPSGPPNSVQSAGPSATPSGVLWSTGRRQGALTICGTIRRTVRCAVWRAVSRPGGYSFWCTRGYAADAAVRCAKRGTIYGIVQHAVCCAVWVSEQRAVSWPVSYAFGGTMV